MKENKLIDLSTDFAIKVVKTCKLIKGHYSIVNQFERAGTSIGANIREANYAHGLTDFIFKLRIAAKECSESLYWLQVFAETELLDKNIAKELSDQCGTLLRILSASINTATQNNSKK